MSAERNMLAVFSRPTRNVGRENATKNRRTSRDPGRAQLDVSGKLYTCPLSAAWIKAIMAPLQGRMSARGLQGFSDSVRDKTTEVEWISRRCVPRMRGTPLC